jgi:uncharacterized coiled-coil DUF342 family protein
VWKLSQDIAQWTKACETVYESLDAHRAEAAGLKYELDAANAEVTALKEEVSNVLYNVR